MVKESENAVKAPRTPRKTAETGAASGATKVIRKAEIAARIDDDKVGTMLYHERIKKGLDLAKISQTLCIRRFYLDAIEKGNYGDLPPIPYSIGFVSSYAKYLGMNHTRIAQLFREEISAKPNKAPIFITEEVPAEAALPKKIYFIAVAAVVLLVVALWGIFSPSSDEAIDKDIAEVVNEESMPETVSSAGEVEYFENEGENSATGAVAPEVKAEAAKVEEKAVAVEQAVEAVEEKNETPAAKVSGTVEIKITKENAWIEVRDDKKVYISKILKVGESYRLPEVPGLKLSAGKHRGVEIYVNGELKPVITASNKRNISIDDLLNENH